MIMLIGIIIQLGMWHPAVMTVKESWLTIILSDFTVSIIVYSYIATEFLRHFNQDRPFRAATSARGIRSVNVNWAILGLRISTVCLFIR